MCQGEKIKCYTQGKKYLVDNVAHILKSIVECTEEWYSSVYNEDYMRAFENSKVLSFWWRWFFVVWFCHILNSC